MLGAQCRFIIQDVVDEEEWRESYQKDLSRAWVA